MNKLLITSWVLVVLLAVLSGWLWLKPNHSVLGGTTNFNDISVDSVTSAGALTATTISGTAITGTTSITAGSGTAITRKQCNNATLTFGSLAGGASSTVSLTLAGVATSSNQVYSASLATSTPTLGGSLLSPFAYPSSTAGAINVNVLNAGATWNGGAVNVSACYDQF